MPEQKHTLAQSLLPEQMLPGEAIFCVQGLDFAYSRPLLRNVNLALYPGQSIGLSGHNGAGKTSLFRCLTGLEKPLKGTLSFLGETVEDEKGFRKLRRKVGFALQDAEDQLFFPEVLEDLEFGPLNLGANAEKARKDALWALNLVGLAGYENRLSHTLSGGEKKLCALAAILAMKPLALLLDEPANALDEKSTSRLIDILNNLNCAKIIISHERDFLEKTCGDIVFLRDGTLENK